jgi:hypothetical protein
VKGRQDKIPDAKYEMKAVTYLSKEAELSESALCRAWLRPPSIWKAAKNTGMIDTEQCKANKVKHIPPSQDLSIKASRRCSGLIVT